MLNSLLRIIKSGCNNFWRDRWLSIAAVAMVFLTIFVIINLLMANVLIDSFVSNLEDKIDVSVYFTLDAPENEILQTKNDLAALQEVRSVEYISSDEALKKFREKHQNNQVLIQSLHEIGTNPLKPSLNIKAQSASQYEAIVGFFNKDKYRDIVDKINYKENEAVIAKLTSITATTRRAGFIILVVLAIIAVFVTFNTIRLAIYSSRKEIKVMKLVGASNWFIRGPFIVVGALYGIIAAICVSIILLPMLWYLSPRIATYLPGANIFQYFSGNLFSLLLLQVVIGVSLGMSSSLISMRRYLEI